MISAIIPAHNEEMVIGRCLKCLLDGARPGELEVIVACNGCTDRTAASARAFGPPVQVVEIPTASKTAALNVADQIATSFPRFYLDADVRLGIDDIRRLAAALELPGALLAAPKLRMDLRHTAWAVRAFYEVWTRLPYNQTMVGTGVYALSAAGRSRFDRFPDVIADDGFVRFQFARGERATVADAEVWVDPPRTLAGLIRIKTRARLGQYQLRDRYPELRGTDSKPRSSLLWTLLRQPVLWPCVLVYLGINLLTRWRARYMQTARRAYTWERDDSRHL